MRLSFRARLTAWYVGVLAAIIAVLAVFVAVQLRSELEQRVERSLEADSAQLARAYPEGRAEFVDVSSPTAGRRAARWWQPSRSGTP